MVSLVCTLALLKLTGFRASDLSTAEKADAEELREEIAAASRQEPVGQPSAQRALA
ncbi:hypothetical protein D3C81_2160460 [compost metagenome]